MDQYYKVTNKAKDVISWPWVTGLLTPSQKLAYEQFKQSEEYIGTGSEKVNRKKVPEADRAKVFYEGIGEGHYFEEFYNNRGVTESKRTLKWFIAPDYDQIRNTTPSGIYVSRNLCQKYKITFTAKDTVEDLLKKLQDKFGSNVKVLSQSQAAESGLKSSHGRREIIQRLIPGKRLVEEVMYTGELVFEEITPDEAEELLGTKPEEDYREAIDGTDISKLDRKTLIDMAKTRGITDGHRKSTADLISLLQ